MALYPYSFSGQEKLQPGGRGEKFIQDIPGYRNQDGRINRTNATLNTSAHDVTNISYAMDSRLPVLFRYGWGYGFNQIVMTKGTIVAIDPLISKIDFEDKKHHNILTIANGGKNVKPYQPSKTDPQYKKWQETKEDVEFKNGKLFVEEEEKENYRIANKPIGIIMRNEYTRNDNAFNGMDPGAVLTDSLVELPWFIEQDKALDNPWGCAYGNFKPGDLVKSDENGKFIKSPLSDESTIPTDIKEYEKERQQVIGEIYETKPDLIPMGAAIYAQWALEDRMNFEDFNPSTHRGNNRDGEDIVSNSPYESTGEYPGYPYEKGYMAHDLHMISQDNKGGRGGVYDPRLQLEYQLRNGIPGLTDGYNAYKEDSLNTVCGNIAAKKDAAIIPKGTKYIFRALEVNLEKMIITIGKETTQEKYNTADSTMLGEEIEYTIGSSKITFIVDYVDNKQGIVGLTTKEDFSAAIDEDIPVYLSYTKRGKSGVPTNLDWDGCKGTIKILLQK